MRCRSRARGADLYLAATKIWVNGPFDHTWLADLTLRESEANQIGILGFGGDRGGYHLPAEIAPLLRDKAARGERLST